ncbi:hypothetical protein ACQ86N_41230 [Puia sp. P3]|uniref:hypothetical protein n=1 Tax=Puia sp. P3 TaxID=3423952 RepID=UPI003D67B969
MASIKPNINWGVSMSSDIETMGVPLAAWGGGIFHSTYKGWGLEANVNPSLSMRQQIVRPSDR